MNTMTKLVDQNLNFYMPGPLEVPFQIEAIVTEGFAGLILSEQKRVLEFFDRHLAGTPTATAHGNVRDAATVV